MTWIWYTKELGSPVGTSSNLRFRWLVEDRRGFNPGMTVLDLAGSRGSIESECVKPFVMFTKKGFEFSFEEPNTLSVQVDPIKSTEMFQR